MKRNNLLIMAGMLSVMTLSNSGCKKDDDDNSSSGTPAPQESMTAKIDGVSWSAASNQASGSIVNNVSNLTGVASDNSTITITVQESFVQGETYDIGFGTGNAGVYSIQGATSSWASNGNANCYGSITVSTLDAANKKMSGTFTFKAWRATDNTYKVITEGAFANVPYVTSISGGGTNTFTIKIDNVPFSPAVITGMDLGGSIMINASDNQGEQAVLLQFPLNITAGTYPILYATPYSAMYNQDQSTNTVAVSGSLTISSHNQVTKTIAGTCYFVAQPLIGPPPSFSLSQGAFTVTYQ